ncbi:radical SAM protein [Propionispira raffinosivorans]|uniref:radical SAM protein n=1 Tax=Propionispira raffinosivorans TaxID=86959 RepID=UPI00035F037B|nr:radical SAM protein [Propionispira raffinosivorans]
MKWTKQGHEFDAVYKTMQEKMEFYFFGAGDYGKQFINIMSKEITIKGFIDNNRQKHGEVFVGYNCESLDAIDFTPKKTGIVITVSQIQRGAITKQLQANGYVHNQDFFIIEEFLSIYFVYKYNQVYFSSISFLPSTACNLKCRACLNFNPYAKQFYVREWKDIKKDIDLFFQCVDKIMLFHVSGGEPMLYKGIAEIIEYIDHNYGDRIDTLRTVTNGTIVPDDSVLERLSKCKVEITVDDYREAVPQYSGDFSKLIEKLQKYQIRYYINKTAEWIDLAPDKTDFSHWSEEQLQKHFDECCQAWQELRDGRLHSCNYDAYATVAGINPEPDEEIFDLNNFNDNRKKEIVEFRLGYNGKGYTNFCKKCRGFSEKNQYKGKPAKQME